jgi:hypothetical protein
MSKESDHLQEILKTPCPHEADHAPTTKTVADCHPLSYDDVRGLVTLAFNQQAIPDMICPYPIDGPVAKKLRQLNATFVDGLHAGDADGTIRKIATILSLIPTGR